MNAVEPGVARALLVRHCESTGPAPDAPLTALGYEQAVSLAERLATHPIDLVVSSPYRRARETIAPFAARSGLRLHVDDRLAERRMSSEPVAGWREALERSFHDPHHRLPGGESGAETLARGMAAIAAVVGPDHRLPVLVTHGQLLSLVLHAIDPSFGFAGWQALTNPDVILLERDGPRWSFSKPVS